MYGQATQADYLSKVARTAQVDIETLLAHNAHVLKDLNASLAGKTLLVCSKLCPHPVLQESMRWRTVQVKSDQATFIGICDSLPLRQANINFAVDYCRQKGGFVAYWNTRQEYADLSRLAIEKSKTSGNLVDIYIGLKQQDGFDEPEGGWVWQHDASLTHQQYAMEARTKQL